MRLINADELIENLKENISDDHSWTVNKTLEEVVVLIEEYPAVEAKEKTGTWTLKIDKNDRPLFWRKFYCSNCGNWNTYGTPPYCMYCGAKMINSANAKKELGDVEDGED